MPHSLNVTNTPLITYPQSSSICNAIKISPLTMAKSNYSFKI